MKFRFIGQKGFSIIELMIVVGIIGVLASVGLPKMQVFLAKSKRAEVKTVLGSFQTFEEAYNADNGAYGSDVAIGFSSAADKPKMKFNTATWTFAHTLPAGGFSATMTSVANKLCTMATGADLDVWTITASTSIKGSGGAAPVTANGTDWKSPACT